MLYKNFAVVDREQNEFPLKSSNQTAAAAFEPYQPSQTKEPVFKKGVRLVDYNECDANNFNHRQLSDFSLERSSDEHISDTDSELDTEAAQYITSNVSFLEICIFGFFLCCFMQQLNE